MDWFRSWHGAPTDSKWLVIARRANVTPLTVSAVFWALLDYASQQPERGSVAGFDVETYATWAGVEESDILAVLDAMRAKGVITDGDTLAAWDKRQPKREDSSAERVRRHREKQRNSVTDDDVTQCNASVTQCNAPDTDTDTDRETEAETEKAQATLVATPNETPKKRKGNPDKEHPCVLAYRDLHNRWPQAAQMRLIVEHDPPVDAFVRALRAWAAKGYSPNNIGGVLDWAENPAKMDKATGTNGHYQNGRFMPDDDVPTYMKMKDYTNA